VNCLRTPRSPLKIFFEKGVETFFGASTLLSVSITLGILFVLIREAIPFFEHVTLKEFLTSTQWAPLFVPPHYGIAPLLVGTLVTTGIACIVALPSGLMVALLLSEYVDDRIRAWLKTIIELLAAVPSVVFGYFALLVVTPWLQNFIPELQGFNRLSAGLVLGLLILPYMASLSEDALKAVPNTTREASYALGASRFTTAFQVVVPSAFSGICSASILSISRALGETMVVAIAAGMLPSMSLDPTQPSATVTAYIVQVSMGDLPHGTVGYQSIFSAGLMLALITFSLNILAYKLRQTKTQKANT
jgi:phosphate transport system permease protein